MNVEWRETYKDRIRDVADATIRSVEHLGDDSLIKKINTAQRLGFQFATLLSERPALSTVAVENWTVPRYRQLFDDLSALEREFKLRGDGGLPTPIAPLAEPLAVMSIESATWHEAGATPPSEYPAGPLTGTKGQLAKWILRKKIIGPWKRLSIEAHTGDVKIRELDAPCGSKRKRDTPKRIAAVWPIKSDKRFDAR